MLKLPDTVNYFMEVVMKKIFLVLFATFMVFACGKKEETKTNETKETKLKVGVVLSREGLGDKSFNDSAYAGLQKAIKELGVQGKYVEPGNIAAYPDYLREFAEADYDLIIGLGYEMVESMKAVAKEYPESNFMIVDEPIELPNVKSAIYDEAEGSFLAGAIAGLTSKKNSVAFIGGADMPLIRSFGNGFFAGAKYVNKDTKTTSSFVGGDKPFNDPARAKEIALSFFDGGADIVYHAAAGSGMGVFEAAKQKKGYAIGVDSDQDDIVPGVILTSMIKDVGGAIFLTVDETIKNGFTPGVTKFDLSNDGVRLTDFRNTKDIIGEDNIKKVEEIKQKIVNKEIDVKKLIEEL